MKNREKHIIASEIDSEPAAKKKRSGYTIKSEKQKKLKRFSLHVNAENHKIIDTAFRKRLLSKYVSINGFIAECILAYIEREDKEKGKKGKQDKPQSNGIVNSNQTDSRDIELALIRYLSEQTTELRRIGINLNQLVKKDNSGKLSSKARKKKEDDIAEVLVLLKSLLDFNVQYHRNAKEKMNIDNKL